MPAELGQNSTPNTNRARRPRDADAAVIDLLGAGVAEGFLRSLAAKYRETPFGDVEDALFESIADAWRRMHRQPIDDLRAYVYRSASYQLARNARRRRRLSPLVEHADGPLDADSDQAHAPKANVEFRDQDAADQAAAEAADEHREAALRYLRAAIEVCDQPGWLRETMHTCGMRARNL